MSLGQKILRSSGIMILSGYSMLIVSFLGNLVLSRILLPEDFGVYALAQSTLSIIFMFAGFGSQEAIIQNRDATLQHFIPTAFWISVGIALALALLGTFFGYLLVGTYASPIPAFIVISSWLSLLGAVGSAYGAIMTRKMEFKNIAILQSSATLISFFIAVVAALLGAGPWALIIRELVMSIITVCAYILMGQYAVAMTFDIRSARSIWRFGWQMMVSRISEVIFGRFDNFMVGTFIGTVTLGHYSLAYRLGSLGHQITQSAIQPVVLSVFSELQNSPKQLQYAFDHMIFWLIRIAILLSILVLLLGQDLVTLIYTDKWLLAGDIFQSMWIFLGVMPIHEAVRHVLIGAGYIDKVIHSRLIMLSFFLPALALAVFLQDIFAIVWVVSISLSLSTALMFRHLARVIPMRWLFMFKNPLLAAIGSLFFSLVIQQTFLSNSAFLVGIIVKGFLIPSAFCGFLLLLELKMVKSEFGLIWSKLVTNKKMPT